MYIWPEESSMFICDVDLFDVVQNDVYEFENKGSVYLIGDLNSRVGFRNNYIVCDSVNDHMDSDEYVPDVPLARDSWDKTCNTFGLKLLDLCKSTCFRIVKGRLGHEFGNGVFTFASQQGASVIDYVLARECDFANINMFSVQDFSGFSDHCPISFSLNCYVQFNEKTL